ncbi:hypothetical protein G9P44_004858 [Scheffersomyces stipitis]|nr:hypothetical protein G9P44_004858 [Scheffersomyces stipitis]
MSSDSSTRNPQLHAPAGLRVPLNLTTSNLSSPTTATTPTSVSSRHGSSEILSSGSDGDRESVPYTAKSPFSTPKQPIGKRRTVIVNDFKPSSARKPRAGPLSELNENSSKAIKKTSSKLADIEDDPVVQTAEFKFLYRLYVPNKYLIRNNKMSKKNLLNHLPLIIPSAVNETSPTSSTSSQISSRTSNDYAGLNFQVHLFLSSIMVNYISSWYLTKLNTDDMLFLQSVYQLLSDLVRDISRRVNAVLKDEVSIVGVIDDVASILNKHISDLVAHDSQYELEILRTFQNRANSTNVFDEDPSDDVETVIDRYLASNHLIFRQNVQDTSLQNTINRLGISSENSSKLFTFEKSAFDDTQLTEPPDDPRQLEYFRIITHNILEATFENTTEDYAINPLSSKIGTKLIVSLVSDLIFIKIFDKLSTPDFILDTVGDGIVSAIEKYLDSKSSSISKPVTTSKSVTISSRAQVILSSVYNRVSRIILGVSVSKNTGDTPDSNDVEPDIFGNSVFQLFDTITNFSSRKPLLTGILVFCKDLLQINSSVAAKVNSICTGYISKKILSSNFIGDGSLSGIISDLRVNIFEKKDDKKEELEKDRVTVDQLTEKIFNLIRDKIPGLLPSFTRVTPFFNYFEETDEDLKEAIRRMLVIFNYENGSDNIELHETCKLNKLLMINLIDCVIRTLYPELVQNTI